MKTLKKAGVAISTGCIVVGGFTVFPAHAAPSAASAKVDSYMVAVPHGTKLSNNEISYEGGQVRVLMNATAKSCKAGWYCVWEHSNWRGAMAKWSTTAAHCKKYKFKKHWRNKVSSFWARGGCERRNYFLKDAKAHQPDPFEYFEGKKAYVRYNDRYDYASRGL
ncbi:peptidase inhibitor family I36 protein [Streptomyces qinglanensis]|uniref:Peptidase inhibitor family I36 n=1 Tax=Streptomyces qinglanensis TaxID=943816 RepID=A0A1H9RUR3_9ACTN|nr:peptidase inhibitor family I36 protein [Streptomyces qinglanensis]SER76165.1 Peptidase inhibitor family I36 [Streptomyces qinglanensis]